MGKVIKLNFKEIKNGFSLTACIIYAIVALIFVISPLNLVEANTDDGSFFIAGIGIRMIINLLIITTFTENIIRGSLVEKISHGINKWQLFFGYVITFIIINVIISILAPAILYLVYSVIFDFKLKFTISKLTIVCAMEMIAILKYSALVSMLMLSMRRKSDGSLMVIIMVVLNIYMIFKEGQIYFWKAFPYKIAIIDVIFSILMIIAGIWYMTKHDYE
ncbi:MAG: hypothetical protein K6G26_05515 [Lachnospiraceae bacterium]|nr:hypothetical protein [Lachnospiraceae bacterium]